MKPNKTPPGRPLIYSEDYRADVKHVNIPIFIPHLGCPNNCVFCNQHNISGVTHFDPNAVESQIAAALSSIDSIDKKNTEIEIAFFGGSFTGINRDNMFYLLNTAQKYIDSGDADSIRLSTRPDYIDDDILHILSCFAVKTIELGIQSLSDDVLSACKRGHTAACAEKACLDILEAGFTLVGQMMVGLPRSESAEEIYTARRLCSLGVNAARIYPAVVLYDTELYHMTKRGLYKPLSIDQAVQRSCDILEVFIGENIPVIRIGLCASDNLDRDSVYAGGYHPAMGELTISALYLKYIYQAFSSLNLNKEDLSGGDYIIYCPRGAVSKVTGQNKRNIKHIKSEFNINNIKIIETDTIEGYNIKIASAI